MVVCSKCGGPNVKVATWVNPNTHEILDEFGSWSETDTKWCEDCQENVELIDDSLKETEDGRDGEPSTRAGEDDEHGAEV